MISEPILIRLFCGSLRPSIRSQAKQESRQKNLWDQAIQKAITAKAKAALNLPLLVREMDSCCSRGHRSALKPTKDHTRDRGSFSFHPQKAQTMPLYCFKQVETSERSNRDHQKGRHDRNCCDRGPRGFRPQGSTSATRVNTTKILARNDCGRNQPVHQKDKDMSRTTCYNCNKKSHFANQCP